MTLTLFEEYGPVILSNISVCLVSSHGWIEVKHFRQEYHRNDVSFLVGHCQCYMVSICVITGDVNLDYLAKGEVSGFLHCKVIVSLLAIDTYLGWGEVILRLCKTSFLLRLSPTDF